MNNTITTIYLDQNQIGDKGVSSLVSALERNNTITTFDLEWNQVNHRSDNLFLINLEVKPIFLQKIEQLIIRNKKNQQINKNSNT